MDNALGKNIKYYRKLKGYSQQQLAEKTGLSKMSIRRYESGERQPRIETIKKIATALRVSLNDLMPDTFEQTKETGRELGARDYGFIEILASHEIFSDNDRKVIFSQIEKYRTALSNMVDIDKMEAYSEITHHKLEDTLLKMILDKPDNNTTDIIIVLSCFLSLKNTTQDSIIDILTDNCYPDAELKCFN